MNFYNYVLRMADNSLILGHRLSELCGHGPVLEQDIAVTNIALDLVGQARNLFALAADMQGKTEDDLAYLREEDAYQNLLLVEQPNGDFAHTVTRQFFFSAFQLPFYETLQRVLSNNTAEKVEILRGIVEKAIKEVRYHLRWSSEWVIRLGDGTAESHERMQQAVAHLYPYIGEALTADEVDKTAFEEGYGVDLNTLKPIFDATITDVLTEATLQKGENGYIHTGGKQGIHTEYMGYLLAEMQYLQRAYPNATW